MDRPTEQVSVKLPPPLREQVERIAEAETRTLAQQIRHYVAEGVRRAESLERAA
jgi:predicted DNA-binding protein